MTEKWNSSSLDEQIDTSDEFLDGDVNININTDQFIADCEREAGVAKHLLKSRILDRSRIKLMK